MKVDDPIYIDVGIYGFPNKKGFSKVQTSKKMERFVIDHKGYMVNT